MNHRGVAGLGRELLEYGLAGDHLATVPHNRAVELEVGGRQRASVQRQLRRARKRVRVVDRDQVELGVGRHREPDADQARSQS
jgi:hypothetical protein